MTRATYGFRQHTLKPHTGDSAERTLFSIECKGCAESSEPSEKAEDGCAWAVGHLKANPGHLKYRERITRSYHFEAGKWL